MTKSPNILELIEADREAEAIAQLMGGVRLTGAVGPRSAKAAIKAAADLFAGDLMKTITFMNYRHPWLQGQTVMERAEDSDEGLEFVLDMIGAIQAGVHI